VPLAFHLLALRPGPRGGDERKQVELAGEDAAHPLADDSFLRVGNGVKKKR